MLAAISTLHLVLILPFVLVPLIVIVVLIVRSSKKGRAGSPPPLPAPQDKME